MVARGQCLRARAHPDTCTATSQGAHEPWALTKRRIFTDSTRTASDGPLFRGEGRPAAVARLERLLMAYALADAGTGYCQGMADLAAPVVHLYDTDAEVGSPERGFMCAQASVGVTEWGALDCARSASAQ